jgi:murein DD-endopeptidase MepM/ murein hydrolase activator NlpD
VFTIPDISDARRRCIALRAEGKTGATMSKFKLYYCSSGSTEIVEARWIRTKLASWSAILGMAILAVSFGANTILGDPLGLGFRQTKALRAENAGLSVFENRLRTLRETLASLNDQENEVRLLVDLPEVDADTRRAGIGGTDERIDHGVASDLNSQLNELRASLNSAERELQLEQTLWSADVAKYNSNKAMYSCIPAIKPMQGRYSMSGFGMRFHPVYHVMRLHEGLDIVNEVGTDVYATGDGVVVMAGSTSTGLGTLIVLNHGYGYTTLYGHLSKVLVHAGARVKRGDIIALSGESGVVTGPHLHFAVRLNGRLEDPVDHFFDDFDPSKGSKQKAFSW